MIHLRYSDQNNLSNIQIQAAAELEFQKRIVEEGIEHEQKKQWEAEQELRKYYQTHPIDWIVDKLGVKREMIDWELLPEYQKHRWDGTRNPFVTVLNALVNNRWVAIEGATGVSKTFIAACIVLWFFDCFENSMSVTTAPKEGQLNLHIWKEIGSLYPRYNKGKYSNLKIQMIPGMNDWSITGFVAGVRAEEVTASARKAQGFHAEHLLIITEETPGVSDAVMTAFQNTCVAPHNLIMALGNPDNQFDTLHKFSQLSRVEAVTISGFDYPNVVLRNPNYIPGAQSEQGLADMLDRYKNPEHPLYLSRARGISPKQAKDALIRYEWLIESRERRIQYEDEKGNPNLEKIKGSISLGVDVANSEDGDEASIIEGKGNVCTSVESFPCPDSNELGRTVNERMIAKKIGDLYVGVDGVGVGAGTVNELKRLGRNIVNIISSESPAEIQEETEDEESKEKKTIIPVEQFNNLRSQMWWQCSLDLRNGVLAIPLDEELFADLMSPRWFTRNGKIHIESKEEIKKRLGRSPNRGDAFVYWNWVRSLRSVEPAMQGMIDKKDQQDQPKQRYDIHNEQARTPGAGRMVRSF